MNIKSINNNSILQAAELLHKGEVVAFPTETVYGLGADATNDRAVAEIFSVKGRPQFNPLIVHVDSVAMAKKYVIWNEAAEKLAAHFSPGPI
ncbi:MAG: L-threonylcarbamoyladenylate synthase, partial [Pseudomonadota bacterium]